MFSGTPSVSAMTAAGAVPVRWMGQHTFAAPGQWIAQIHARAGSTRHQLAMINERLAGTGLRAARRLNQNAFLVRGPQLPIDRVRTALSALPGFASVEPDTVRVVQSIPNDPSFPSQWGLNQSSDADIDAPEAWNLTTGTNSVVTAVLDTGVDWSHPDLAANIWNNPKEIANNGIDDDGDGFIDDNRGWDFANGDNNPMDDNGHGTGVAGVIGAVGNNNLGVTGVAWQAKILPLKFITSTGMGYTSNAVAALNYALTLKSQGVNLRVINNSSTGNYSSALSFAIDQLNAADVLFVAGAGNGDANGVGINNDTTPTYPASLMQTNVISVAATDSQDQLAGFSNYGATSVDLAAPGVNIFSTALGGGYGGGTGTSYSTPFVSGAAALAFAYNSTATAAQVKSALINGVDHLPALTGKMVSGGRLNVYNALTLLNPAANGTGLAVTWYDNKDLTGTAVTGSAGPINYNWGTGSPDSAIGPDTFSAVWSGTVLARYTEPYTLYTLADDGVRVWIENLLVIDRWNNHPPIGDFNGDGRVNAIDFSKLASVYAAGGPAVAPYDLNSDGVINSIDFGILSSNFGRTVDPIENSGVFSMQAGQTYRIFVQYYENYGVASMKLSWSSPSTPKQVIPASFLFSTSSATSQSTIAQAQKSPALFSGQPIGDSKDSVLT